MKKWISVLMIFTSLMVFGQEEETIEFKTIFGNDHSSGGYGAPELKLGPVNKEISLFVGGRGGWIIGHKFVIGGAGYGLTTNNTFEYTESLSAESGGAVADSTRSIKIDMGYGGLLLEYILKPKKAIHIAFPLIIGAGGTSLGVKTTEEIPNTNPSEWSAYDFVESSAFFVVEPGLSVELNMTKFFRLNLGGTYRFISGTNLERLSSSDLSDFTFNIALKFGAF